MPVTERFLPKRAGISAAPSGRSECVVTGGNRDLIPVRDAAVDKQKGGPV